MKTPPIHRLALVTGLLATAACTALRADDSASTPPPPPPPPHGHMDMLTPDEHAELKKDRDAVYAADPSLKTQEQSLREQMHQLEDKVDAAVIKQDPAAAPIIAKMKADHHHHGPPSPDGQ